MKIKHEQFTSNYWEVHKFKGDLNTRVKSNIRKQLSSGFNQQV